MCININLLSPQTNILIIKIIDYDKRISDKKCADKYLFVISLSRMISFSLYIAICHRSKSTLQEEQFSHHEI